MKQSLNARNNIQDKIDKVAEPQHISITERHCKTCKTELNEENNTYYNTSGNLHNYCNRCYCINHRKEHRKRREQMRLDIFERLGNKCKKCGFSDPRALQIDHINGRNKEKRMQWYAFRNYLLDLPESELFKNYQILCANCNKIKQYEENEFGSRPIMYVEE